MFYSRNIGCKLLSRSFPVRHASIVSRSSVSSEALLPALTMNREVTQRILSGEHVHSLQKNIIWSSETGMMKEWTHLELTPKYLRIEYTGPTLAFKRSAELFFYSDDEVVSKGIPLCFKPVRIENGMSVGAGATIFLDRQNLAAFLKSHLSLVEH